MSWKIGGWGIKNRNFGLANYSNEFQLGISVVTLSWRREDQSIEVIARKKMSPEEQRGRGGGNKCNLGEVWHRIKSTETGRTRVL